MKTILCLLCASVVACAIVSGAGIGFAGSAIRVLIITLVTREQRAGSVALGRVAGNFGLGLGATVAGFIVASAQEISSFQALYVFDAVTYAVSALIVVAAVPIPRAVTVAATEASGTGYRAVARDRVFLTVIAVFTGRAVIPVWLGAARKTRCEPRRSSSRLSSSTVRTVLC